MARTTPGRRPLRYESVEAILPDVDRLAPAHRTVGRWSLGQICNHLAFAFDATVHGFPTRPFPGPIRATVGRLLLRQMLGSGRIPEGVWLPKAIQPTPGLDATAEVERLRRAVDAFLATPAPAGVHPFFGTMTPEQWRRYHCIHCAHHMSFVVPAEE